MKLLVVDDSDTIRRAIARALENDGNDIRTASDGLRALRAIEDFAPDIVTMDLSMPNMDGLTCIARILRMRPATRILVVSAFKDKAAAVQAIRLGAQGFLVKPFTSEALCAEIAELGV